MLRRFAIAWVCIVAASVGARAQTAIDVPSGDVWSHRWSTLKVPPKIAGFERTKIVQYTTDEHNLAAMLTDEATSTSATLYVFKPGVDALPIWTDRAVIAMLSSGSLGTINLDGVRMRAITPSGVSVVPSGYRVTASVAGGQASSTGLAIFALDGWIVKLRMTSAKLDSASLGAKLSEFVAALPVGNEKAPALPFVMINDCAEKLTFEKKAKLVRLDMIGAMIAGTALGAARKEASKDTTRESTIWCRDAVGKDFTAYRPNQRTDTFVVAFNDAGLAATVGKVDFGGLIKLRNGHFVSVSDGVREEILPPFEQMPTPEQVAGAIGSIAPITTFDLRAESDAGQTIIVPPR